MAERVAAAPRSRGFSLLEVLVAFSILAVSLTVIFHVFSTGLRVAALTHNYSYATALAESKLAELGRIQPLVPGIEEGVFLNQRHRWRTAVTLADWWDEFGDEQLPVRPYHVTVQVLWQGPSQKEQALSLTTVRLVPKP